LMALLGGWRILLLLLAGVAEVEVEGTGLIGGLELFKLTMVTPPEILLPTSCCELNAAFFCRTQASTLSVKSTGYAEHNLVASCCSSACAGRCSSTKSSAC